MVTYGLHASDDFLYVINGLRKLSSASWFWPRPRPQRFVLGLGVENLSSFNITGCFVDCMHRVPSNCCNIAFAYKRITKCNSVSLNVRVWDAASSGTIQMRPNVARRFSDFATNSRAMTSMSMLYSLSLCTCRTVRWLSHCWLIELRKYVFRRCSDEKLHSTKKSRGTNTLLVPQPKSWGGAYSLIYWFLIYLVYFIWCNKQDLCV